MGEWISCFTDVSTQEACTVTQKLDLDQMSERSIRIMITLTFCCKFWVFRFCICRSYILGKWLQKEDTAETAVHFVFKWLFEDSPVSNNSRMLETEDFGDIASAYMPFKRGI